MDDLLQTQPINIERGFTAYLPSAERLSQLINNVSIYLFSFYLFFSNPRLAHKMTEDYRYPDIKFVQDNTKEKSEKSDFITVLIKILFQKPI